MVQDYIKKQSALFEEYYHLKEELADGADIRELADSVDIREFADALEDAKTCEDFYDVLFYSGLDSLLANCTIVPLALELHFNMDDVAEFLGVQSKADYVKVHAIDGVDTWDKGGTGWACKEWLFLLYAAYDERRAAVESHFLWLERDFIIEEARKAAHLLVA